MPHPLENPDYDEMLVTQMASQSELFSSYIRAAVSEIDADFPTEEIWLGTFNTGKDQAHTQIKIVISRDPQQFLDEN